MSSGATEFVAGFGQQPLRGSLIITIFGDSIVHRGGAISLGSLISLAAPFGFNARLVWGSPKRRKILDADETPLLPSVDL
jgi:hypothetical protein